MMSKLSAAPKISKPTHLSKKAFLSLNEPDPTELQA
jgi:hypothetical protein